MAESRSLLQIQRDFFRCYVGAGAGLPAPRAYRGGGGAGTKVTFAGGKQFTLELLDYSGKFPLCQPRMDFLPGSHVLSAFYHLSLRILDNGIAAIQYCQWAHAIE